MASSGTGQQGKSGALEHWQVVWLKAVARTWRDPEFEKELIADPREALKKEFGFELPACWELEVAPAPAPKGKKGASTHAAHKLRMHLPPKPKADDEAVALAEVAGYVTASCCGQPCC
jgi:ribosomally synthesized peptide (two-chain TOMM family)